MKSTHIRQLRDTFWTEKGRDHVWSQPASLIVNAADDPTTMFNTAGMQPLVPYLMGKEHPTGSKRVYNIQGCVRTVDIEEVGDVSHLTFFEMMGNWSLGDYFKKESITRSREFLTSESGLGLDPEMITVTIFEGDADAPLDTEARDIWKSLGVADHRITPLDKKENRRGPAGATGPCGPDSEIFYRLGEGKPPVDSHPGNDEDNWIEIWNNVFMGYYKDDKGAISEMKSKNVDTGMGFERIIMVKQGDTIKKTNPVFQVKTLSAYDIDIFQSFFTVLDTYSSTIYTTLVGEGQEGLGSDFSNTYLPSYRIVADHMRTALFLVNEGLCPSNEGRGYVLRRIIRRCYYHLRKIGPDTNPLSKKAVLHELITSLCETFVTYYSHLRESISSDVAVIVDEMNQFQQTLTKGGNKIDQILATHDGSIFAGSDAFLLYDTYGVPVELTQEIVAAQGLTVDMKGYTQAMQEAKERSRAGASDKFLKGVNWADYIQGLPETKFVGYDDLEKSDMKILKDFEAGGSRYLVFDQTPFYAESGGQTGDSGVCILESGEKVYICDTQKYGGVWLHKVG